MAESEKYDEPKSKKQKLEKSDVEPSSEPQPKKQKMGHESMAEIIKDPIHGSVELHPLLYKIINTEEFSRLKFIRQLGGVFCVYPGATHTRFEHSIGVCHLAGTFIRSLKEKQPDLKITKEEVLCVEIAGLCHDLGHGPFSHVFDKNVLTEFGKKGEEELKHEDISLHILEVIYKDRLKNEFDSAFDNESDNEFDNESEKNAREYVNIIKKMIHPTKKSKIEPFMKDERDRYFLYQIVANKETGIDVDKWDYFMRDYHYMGIPHDFDWKRLMQLSRVINVQEKDENDKEFSCKKICFNQKEISNIIGMFRTRFNLHEKAYQHKAVLAVEERLSTALLEVKDEPLVFGIDCCEKKASSRSSLSDIYKQLKSEPADVSGFLALTDDIIHIIMHKKTSEVVNSEANLKKVVNGEANLKKASELLRDLFYRRKKFHLVKKFTITQHSKDHKDILKDGIVEQLKSDYKFQADCIFCKDVEFSYFSERKRKKKIKTVPDSTSADTQNNADMNPTGTPASKKLSDPMNTSLADIHFFSKDTPNEAKTFTEEELCEQFIPRQFESRQVWLYNGHEENGIDDDTLLKCAEKVVKEVFEEN